MPLAKNALNDVLSLWTGKVDSINWGLNTNPGGGIYLGLTAQNPTWDGGGGANIIEHSGDNYLRQPVPNADWTLVVSGNLGITVPDRATYSGTEIAFGPADVDWLSGANISYLVYLKHVSNKADADYLSFKLLETPKQIKADDTAKFLSDDLRLTLGGSI